MIWDGYIAISRDLATFEFEAAKRSAISRAYYGAFNVARRRLEAQGIPIDNHRAHRRVWRIFRVADRATPDSRASWRIVGELGGTLLALRNLADYADFVPRLDRQATDAVGIAERILALLDELEFS